MAATLGTANPLRYRGYVYDQETDLYYLQSRYYNSEIGRFINADGYTSTGQGFFGNNAFVYCGNNPIFFQDPDGRAQIPSWEDLGFKYDGSMRDFKRLNQGLPPYSFEIYLANGGTLETDFTDDIGNGVKRKTTKVTYIPKDMTLQYYVEILENSLDSTEDDILLGVSTVLSFVEKLPGWVSALLSGADYASSYQSKIEKSEIHSFKRAMSKGKGVLIIEWELSGPSDRIWYTECVSWDGVGYYGQ